MFASVARKLGKKAAKCWKKPKLIEKVTNLALNKVAKIAKLPNANFGCDLTLKLVKITTTHQINKCYGLVITTP